jgi:hypothetical protein
LENKRKTATKLPISVLKKKNKVEEGGTLGVGAKKEQENIEAKAQKMMRRRVAPFAVPTSVWVGR